RPKIPFRLEPTSGLVSARPRLAPAAANSGSQRCLPPAVPLRWRVTRELTYGLMRRIGTLTDRQQAERFGDFLLTRQIAAQIDAAGDEWVVWVHEEDQLDETRRELDAFLAEPDAPRYQEADVEADRLRHDRVRRQRQARRKTVNMAERWRRPAVQQMPVTFALIVISVVATFGTRFGDDRAALGGHFNMVPRVRTDGESIYYPADYRSLPGIRDGQLWRLFTPAFLHFGP